MVPVLLRAYRRVHQADDDLAQSTKLLMVDLRELKAKDLGKFFDKWHELELHYMQFLGREKFKGPKAQAGKPKTKAKLAQPPEQPEDFSWTGGQDEEAAASAGNA